MGMWLANVYVFVAVAVMYTYNTGNFGNEPLCLFFLYRVCTHVILGIWSKILCVYVCVAIDFFTRVRLVSWEKILCVYVCAVVEGMYTCKTARFGNNNLCLCFCWCRCYVHM